MSVTAMSLTAQVARVLCHRFRGGPMSNEQWAHYVQAGHADRDLETARQVIAMVVMASPSLGAAGPDLSRREVTIDGTEVNVLKFPDDPICLRASLGGTAAAGYYLTYRGDEAKVRHLLHACATAFEEAQR